MSTNSYDGFWCKWGALVLFGLLVAGMLLLNHYATRPRPHPSLEESARMRIEEERAEHQARMAEYQRRIREAEKRGE